MRGDQIVVVLGLADEGRQLRLREQLPRLDGGRIRHVLLGGEGQQLGQVVLRIDARLALARADGRQLGEQLFHGFLGRVGDEARDRLRRERLGLIDLPELDPRLDQAGDRRRRGDVLRDDS